MSEDAGRHDGNPSPWDGGTPWERDPLPRDRNPSPRAAAHGQGRIFQSERDIQITEHHHHGQPGPAGPSYHGPASVRVALSAPLRSALRDREELRAELLASLAAGGGVHVLHGFGGCGKTAVARWLFDEAARASATGGPSASPTTSPSASATGSPSASPPPSASPTATPPTPPPPHIPLWVDASTEAQLRAGMLAVAADRGATPDEVRAAQEGQRAAADLVWQRLDASPEPWLLVLDNADDPRFLRGGWLRPSAGGTVVVTSRQGVDLAWSHAGARMHRVDVLPVAEAAQLLHDLAPGDHQPEASLRLAERLGCHPLALTLAGGFLSQQLLESWTIDEYLERLGEDPVALLDLGAGFESGSRERISRTWQLSLDDLSRRGLPEAMALLRVLACLGHAPVPVALLAPSAILATGGIPGLAADRVEAGLRGLLSASLVDLVEVPGYESGRPVRCVTVHGLLLETVAAGVPAALRAELRRHVSELTAYSVPRGGDAGSARLLEPHLLTLLGHSATTGPLLDAARSVRDAHDKAGRWAEALPLASGVVRAASPDGRPGDQRAVIDFLVLGNSLDMSGDHAGARPVLKEALRAATARAEESPLLLAQAHMRMSALFGKTGRYREALALSRHAQEIRRRTLGPVHADTAETIAVEVDHLFYLGEFESAVRIARNLFDLLPRLHGERSGEVTAIALLNIAAAMREALYAARDPDIAADGTVIGEEVRALTWDRVWEVSQQALHASIAQFAPSHPLIFSARHNLADVGWERGDQQAAVAEIRGVVAFRTAVLGEAHIYTLHAVATLARMLAMRGETEEAEGLAVRAHSEALRTHGPDHAVTRLCGKAMRPAEQGSLARGRALDTTPEDTVL